jgi:hypothetical protein
MEDRDDEYLASLLASEHPRLYEHPGAAKSRLAPPPCAPRMDSSIGIVSRETPGNVSVSIGNFF